MLSNSNRKKEPLSENRKFIVTRERYEIFIIDRDYKINASAGSMTSFHQQMALKKKVECLDFKNHISTCGQHIFFINNLTSILKKKMFFRGFEKSQNLN